MFHLLFSDYFELFLLYRYQAKNNVHTKSKCNFPYSITQQGSSRNQQIHLFIQITFSHVSVSRLLEFRICYIVMVLNYNHSITPTSKRQRVRKSTRQAGLRNSLWSRTVFDGLTTTFPLHHINVTHTMTKTAFLNLFSYETSNNLAFSKTIQVTSSTLTSFLNYQST